MRIGIIMALPAEYNTSSNLRCISIMNALHKEGHYVKCYMPNPDKKNMYYSSNNKLEINEVMRYGKVIKHNAVTGQKNERTGLRRKLKYTMISVFRRVDIFGATILYLPERKRISKDISKQGFDIIISFSDPVTAHMIAKFCKKRNRKIRYIQQWGDPLAGDTISKTAQPVWIRKIIEHSLLKYADKICYVSPLTCDEQKQMFPKQAKKMVFLPTPSLEYNGVSNIKKKTDELCFGYIGSYQSVARNLKPLYDAASAVKNVELLIIGDSDIKFESTQNIKIIERIPHDKLSDFISKMDVIICVMNKKGNQIPGKIYHDSSLSKDILVIKDGRYGDHIEKFFSQYGHYSFVENDKCKIISMIEKYKLEGVPLRKPVDEFLAASVAKRLIAE